MPDSSVPLRQWLALRDRFRDTLAAAMEEPPFWRPFARRRWREEQIRRAAIRWQRDCWEWSQRHPGVPVMEGGCYHSGTWMQWNGPNPADYDRER